MLLALGLHLAPTHAGPVCMLHAPWVHVCQLYFLFQGIPWALKRGLWWRQPFWCWVFKGISFFYTLPGCGSLFLILYTTEGGFSDDSWSKHLSRSIAACPLDIAMFLCHTVIFGFPLGHCPILSRILGHLSSVRDWFYRTEWALDIGWFLPQA